jgi:hypothetical protein
MGMQIVPSLNITYTEEKGVRDGDIARSEGPDAAEAARRSSAALRGGGEIPEWFCLKSGRQGAARGDLTESPFSRTAAAAAVPEWFAFSSGRQGVAE